jgi:hypothetical protein
LAPRYAVDLFIISLYQCIVSSNLSMGYL